MLELQTKVLNSFCMRWSLLNSGKLLATSLDCVTHSFGASTAAWCLEGSCHRRVREKGDPLWEVAHGVVLSAAAKEALVSRSAKL